MVGKALSTVSAPLKIVNQFKDPIKLTWCEPVCFSECKNTVGPF